ncbi:hypothetical protein ACLOJK_006253 [Asimina triloba]
MCSLAVLVLCPKFLGLHHWDEAHSHAAVARHANRRHSSSITNHRLSSSPIVRLLGYVVRLVWR